MNAALSCADTTRSPEVRTVLRQVRVRASESGQGNGCNAGRIVPGQPAPAGAAGHPPVTAAGIGQMGRRSMDGEPDRAPQFAANVSKAPNAARPSSESAGTRRTEPDEPATFKRAARQVALAIGGFLLACHVWVVRWTNRLVRMPAGSFHEPWDKEPVIIAIWHGEHFLLPFAFRRTDKVNVMVTLHRDG